MEFLDFALRIARRFPAFRLGRFRSPQSMTTGKRAERGNLTCRAAACRRNRVFLLILMDISFTGNHRITLVYDGKCFACY